MTNWLTHYVEMLSWNGERITIDVERVESREPESVNCYDRSLLGFRFFDVNTVEIDGEIMEGRLKKNISGWYYIGKKMTLEHLKEVHTKAAAVAVSTMENYMRNECVDTGFGKYFFLEEDDVVLPEEMRILMKTIATNDF